MKPTGDTGPHYRNATEYDDLTDRAKMIRVLRRDLLRKRKANLKDSALWSWTLEEVSTLTGLSAEQITESSDAMRPDQRGQDRYEIVKSDEVIMNTITNTVWWNGG